MPVYSKVLAKVYHTWGRLTYKNRALPSALLVGPRRTGTTSLYKTLRRHPNIRGASRKEIKFFDCNYFRGMEWYQGFFPRKSTLDSRNAIAIEASPYYSFHPLAAERIKQHFPDIKIIFTLRNPIDRAYSHYQMNYQLGVETLPTFEQAVAAEEDRLAGEERRILQDDEYPLFTHMHLSYLAQGIYADMLSRWFDVFPREQILVINSEEFFSSMPEIFDRMIAFLRLPQWVLNVTKNANPGSYHPMAEDTRHKLVEFYLPHNLRLKELLGRDFGWDE
jgi:Sulfotransferase domain